VRSGLGLARKPSLARISSSSAACASVSLPLLRLPVGSPCLPPAASAGPKYWRPGPAGRVSVAVVTHLATSSGGWTRRVKIRGVRVAAGWGRCRVTAEVCAALRAAGWDGWRGLPVTPAHLGMRTRHLAWRWGLDLRVARCCLEHAGQYSGPGARRPGPPGSPPIPQVKHRRPR
jgi:hypothetical protein